jgi:hypothetical protein
VLDAYGGVALNVPDGEGSAAVGAPFLAVSAGKVYYEVAVEGSAQGSEMYVGLAGTSFQEDCIGNAESWGIFSDGAPHHR